MECQHKKRDGKQCKAPARIGLTSCAMHAQPGRAAEIGRKGGRRRTSYDPSYLRDFVAPKSAGELRDLLGESIIEVRLGKLDPRLANAIGYLGASFLRALEVSDLESRLTALEVNQKLEERAVLGTNTLGDEPK